MDQWFGWLVLWFVYKYMYISYCHCPLDARGV